MRETFRNWVREKVDETGLRDNARCVSDVHMDHSVREVGGAGLHWSYADQKLPYAFERGKKNWVIDKG
jgi:hypothetical protein